MYDILVRLAGQMGYRLGDLPDSERIAILVTREEWDQIRSVDLLPPSETPITHIKVNGFPVIVVAKS